MKIKNVLLVLSGFAGGIAAVGIFVKKLLGVVCKSEYLLTELKDHWIDLFIKLLYASDTDAFIERKLREDGYTRYKYRPRDYSNFKRTYSNWKKDVNDIYKSDFGQRFVNRPSDWDEEDE